MNFSDPSTAQLAAAGGDTVKLFDLSAEAAGDLCTLTYAPSPGHHVNSVKWNHTNLVVASAGEDKKISLWRNNGKSLGSIAISGSDSSDNVEETFLNINFSNKGSRYICSGGSGQVVRIWDLQRKRCVKWLRGHSDAITGAMYNCKDEHLASISLSGDLIIHNLASGSRATELKDPNGQVLRVLDYSRISRHLLITAGDDGSVHLWDSTGRSPKVSWLKQHSAPTAGVCFSPQNDKVIASVGLDKKLFIFDSGSRRPSFFIPYEAPFSSVSFRDDGHYLAAGTSNGQVVFYDVRGKPQPLTMLRAYGNSEAVTSLCWQRSKPVVVNEKSCTDDIALLGGSVEDSVLMPDPLPPVTSNFSVSTAVTGLRNSSRPVPSPELHPSSATASGSVSSAGDLSATEETPLRSNLWNGGALGRLHAPRGYNYKDDMEVFSPLVEVQPITPSLWDQRDGTNKDHDKKFPSLFPSSRRFPPPEAGGSDPHPIFDWKSSSTFKQDDNRSSFSQLVSTPTASSSTTEESSSITPPEAWGGERLSDKFTLNRPSLGLPSRFATLTSTSLSSGSMFTGQASTSSVTSSSLNYVPSRLRDPFSSNQDISLLSSEGPPSSTSLSLGAKDISGQSNLVPLGPTTALQRRLSSYAERISATSSFNDGTGSPKIKKTGAETREELLSSLLPRSEVLAATESGIVSPINGGSPQPQKTPLQPNSQQGSSFTLQLYQGILEETSASLKKSFHEDLRNLHIELLRQFHMHEIEVSNTLNTILETQVEIMKEVQSLRKENQQLRQLL